MKVSRERIEALRAQLGWTQATLSEKSGVVQRTLERILQTGRATPESADCLATALGVAVKAISPGWVDVVIPVGPLTHDEKKMRSVGGLKVLAEVPGPDGRLRPILEHLCCGLEAVEEQVRRVILLTTLEHSPELEARLGECVGRLRAGRIWGDRIQTRPCKHSGRRGMTDGYVDLARDPAVDLSQHFLLHYCDVWPHDPSFYLDLLASLQPISRASSEAQHGGIFACALRVPSNFLTDPDELSARLAARPDSLCRYVSYVHKPFHRVCVHLTRADDHDYFYMNNMAVAVLSRHVLTAVAALTPTPAFRERELFEIITAHLDKRFFFDVFTYRGEWAHADTDEDVEVIRRCDRPPGARGRGRRRVGPT